MCVYEIRFAAEVEQDLRRLKAYDRGRILDAIEEQLPHRATTPSRHRKLLINLVPTWAADPPIWELRVGAYRVFYDVAPKEGIVYVRAIRLKRGGKRTEEIL
jgi:mRNA-degrading endonuclease RelE of RelBE toxin-antitoxin system